MTMHRLLSFIRRDARHAYANAVSIVVMVGILVVPSFYAWFNIAGSWDPYGNTKNLKVALVNEDEGYESDLVPLKLNLGDEVVSTLLASSSIGYEPAARDKAESGLAAGSYYAALIIPKDFSSCLLSGLGGEARQAKVTFMQNQKANAIAEIVTNKASSSIQEDIDTGFARAVTDVGTGALKQLSGMLDDGQLATVARAMQSALDGSAQTLSSTAGSVQAAGDLVGSAQHLLDASSTSLSALTDTEGGLAAALRDGADGVRGLDGALEDATASVKGALDTGAASLDGVSAAIGNAMDTAGGHIDRMTSALADVDSAIQQRLDALRKLADTLDGQDTLVKQMESHFQVGSAEYTKVLEVSLTIEGLAQRVGRAIEELENLSAGIERTAGDLEQGRADADTARAELTQMVADAQSALTSAGDSFNTSLDGSLTDLAGTLEATATGADSALQDLERTGAAVAAATQAASGNLDGMHATLGQTAEDLESAATRIGELQGALSRALDSSDMDQVRTILLTSPAELGAFMAEPVSIERHAVFPVENNGSAMAPFYTTLAIWIGGVVLAALIKATPSAQALQETGCTVTQAYLGRLALFCSTGIIQAAIICIGDVGYLGVQCAHPGLFLLAGCLASVVFISIIFALTSSFGDIGKAVAVVLMVVQVAGAGGTFPAQMLPPVFQTIYAWLPFVHAEGAMRAALFGVYNDDFWIQLAILAAYAVPALALGLLLCRPTATAVKRFEEALESTHVM
ncbi:YhgE/Pip domain-containing protein [Collinsella tanakaei]|uniref:YhgE/Pip domain-containing protein n=1 Tax=Collinsella tanakaei TaxID=626935 RepID=UPI0019575E44|nr:YhgE/Pip domain-containing protein [Collinsella tanakaei]MBM6868305.1 YhgE/Pip domain-containing protein [Collinsella tanakaei]